MSQRKSVNGVVRKHKIIAVIMGACIVLVIIHHLWHAGFDDVMATLQQKIK